MSTWVTVLCLLFLGARVCSGTGELADAVLPEWGGSILNTMEPTHRDHYSNALTEVPREALMGSLG